MAESGGARGLEKKVEELARELERVKGRLHVLEQAGAPTVSRSPAVDAVVSAEPPTPPAVSSGAAPAMGGMSALFGRVAVTCFLLVVALVLRTLSDSHLLAVERGVWLGIGYAVSLGVVGWVLLRRRAGQAATCCVTGAVLLSAVLLEGVFRHQVVPLPVAYGLLAGVAAGTGWALRGFSAGWALWLVGAALFGAGAGLLWARPPMPWPVGLLLVANAMPGRGGPARAVFGAVAWLSLMTLASGWALLLVEALASGAGVPERLTPGWFGGMLGVTLAYFVLSSVLEATRNPERWTDAFHASLLPVTAGWLHLLGSWVQPRLGGTGPWLGWVELAGAALALAAAGWVTRPGDRSKGEAAGAGLLSVGAAALLFVGLPATAGGAAAVVLWAGAAWGLAHLALRWQCGGARLASYLLPAAGCAYGWFAAGLAPGGVSGTAGGVAFGVAGVAAGYQFVTQRRWAVPGQSRFFSTVDRGDDTGSLTLLAAAVYGVLALRNGLNPLLTVFLGEPAGAASGAVSVLLSLAALLLVVVGQRAGDLRVRGVGVLVLVAAGVRVFGFELLASRGLPLVLSVLTFGVTAGVAALVLRRPVGGPTPGPLESGPGDE